MDRKLRRVWMEIGDKDRETAEKENIYLDREKRQN
jgi:hypothetical protein